MQHAEQHMFRFRVDVPSAQRVGLNAGQAERLLGRGRLAAQRRPAGPAAPPPRATRHAPGRLADGLGAEGFLHAAAHRREVDPHAAQQLGVVAPAGRQDALTGQAVQLRPDGRRIQATAPQDACRRAAGLRRDAGQDVLSAEIVMTQPVRLGL
jgi:hypothetical protein